MKKLLRMPTEFWKRMIDAVLAVERTTGYIPRQNLLREQAHTTVRRASDFVAFDRVAALTGAGSSDGFYTAIEQKRTALAWSTNADGLTWDGADGNEPEIYEVNGTTDLYPGDDASALRYVVPLMMLDSNKQPFWFFDANVRINDGGVFEVTMAQTGGYAGDLTLPCTFTYTVSTLDGVPLGASVNPGGGVHGWRRTATGKYIAANMGYARWTSGGFKIGYCNEYPDTGECTT